MSKQETRAHLTSEAQEEHDETRRRIAQSVKPSKAKVTIPEMPPSIAPTYEQFEIVQKENEQLKRDKFALETTAQKMADKIKSYEQKIAKQARIMARFGVNTHEATAS